MNSVGLRICAGLGAFRDCDGRTQQAAPAANPDCMQNCLKFNKTGGGLETDGQRLAGSLTDCCPPQPAAAADGLNVAGHFGLKTAGGLRRGRVGRGEANLKGSKWANLHYYTVCSSSRRINIKGNELRLAALNYYYYCLENLSRTRFFLVSSYFIILCLL